MPELIQVLQKHFPQVIVPTLIATAVYAIVLGLAMCKHKKDKEK